MQDPLPSCHCCQILFITQGGPYDDVRAAGVERLLIHDYATYGSRETSTGMVATTLITEWHENIQSTYEHSMEMF